MIDSREEKMPVLSAFDEYGEHQYTHILSRKKQNHYHPRKSVLQPLKIKASIGAQ